MKTHLTLAVLLSSIWLAGVTGAAPHAGHHAATTAAAADETWADGTIRKIDAAAAKLTIAHGPLEHLGMPAMTMVFRVRDPAQLAQIKVGDKVRFVAEQVEGAMYVTALEKAR